MAAIIRFPSIRAARKQASLTQTQLAAACGVRKASVCQWERGTTTPESRRLAALARTLGPHFDLFGYLVAIEQGRAA